MVEKSITNIILIERRTVSVSTLWKVYSSNSLARRYRKQFNLYSTTDEDSLNCSIKRMIKTKEKRYTNLHASNNESPLKQIYSD